MPHGLQDLSSPTRNWTQVTAEKAPSLNHWTARESPESAHVFSNADLSIWQRTDILSGICLKILWPRKTNQGNKKGQKIWNEAKSWQLLNLNDGFTRGSQYCSLCICVWSTFFTRILFCFYLFYFILFIYLYLYFNFFGWALGCSRS